MVYFDKIITKTPGVAMFKRKKPKNSTDLNRKAKTNDDLNSIHDQNGANPQVDENGNKSQANKLTFASLLEIFSAFRKRVSNWFQQVYTNPNFNKENEKKKSAANAAKKTDALPEFRNIPNVATKMRIVDHVQEEERRAAKQQGKLVSFASKVDSIVANANTQFKPVDPNEKNNPKKKRYSSNKEPNPWEGYSNSIMDYIRFR